MKKDAKVFLKHILESIEAIEDYIKDFHEELFMVNREKQDAIIRRVEIIGEAVKNLPADFKKAHPEISWEEISAMRNKLIHQYFGVDLRLIWQVVKKDLNPLKKQIKKLLL